MLITFKTRAFANVTMFGDVALKLLGLMGRRDTVPSAMEPEDIQSAIDKLRAGIAAEDAAAPEAAAEQEDNESENRVSLRNRALPLLELLEAAKDRHLPVMWEQEKRGF